MSSVLSSPVAVSPVFRCPPQWPSLRISAPSTVACLPRRSFSVRQRRGDRADRARGEPGDQPGEPPLHLLRTGEKKTHPTPPLLGGEVYHHSASQPLRLPFWGPDAPAQGSSSRASSQCQHRAAANVPTWQLPTADTPPPPPTGPWVDPSVLEAGREGRPRAGEKSRPTAATPADNPSCSCKEGRATASRPTRRSPSSRLLFTTVHVAIID